MSDWTDGYVTDIDYGYRYFTLLNPFRARVAFLDSGLAFPEVRTACELGFGQGLSVNIHAAASSIHWYGTDFSPPMARFAQEMAQAAGSNAKLFADSFADFTKRSDLPDFDFIGLHGVWSWISAENRDLIIQFLHNKLKNGGVLYIGYNIQPGWNDFVPVRQLMSQYIAGVNEKDVSRRIRKTVQFIDSFLKTKPRFFQENPALASRLAELRYADERYLAHEYFNRDWTPMAFSELTECLKKADLHYACPAYYLDHFDFLNLTKEQSEFLQGIDDPILKETLYDFITNQDFRTDYWVKGEIQELDEEDERITLQKQKYLLVTPPEKVSLMVSVVQGKRELRQEIYKPILELMSDSCPRTVDQIVQDLGKEEFSSALIYQSMMILMGMRHLEPIPDCECSDRLRFQTKQLNAFLCSQVQQGKDIDFLASPVTGGGIEVSRIEQSFLSSLAQGETEPLKWAEKALSQVSAQRLTDDNRANSLDTPANQHEVLLAEATFFAQKRLPILKALGIA